MAEPKHATVVDGVITTISIMDVETANEFLENGFVEMLWPGGELINLAGIEPEPGVGWTYDPEQTPAWRPSQPGPDWTWDEATNQWVAPAPIEGETPISN